MRESIKVNQYSGWDIRTQNNVEDENEDDDGDEDADETPALCCFSSWNTQEDFNFLMLSSCRGKSLISGSQGL